MLIHFLYVFIALTGDLGDTMQGSVQLLMDSFSPRECSRELKTELKIELKRGQLKTIHLEEEEPCPVWACSLHA